MSNLRTLTKSARWETTHHGMIVPFSILILFCFVCFKESFCSLSTLQSYGRNVKLLIGVFFNFQGEFFNLSNVTFGVGELVIL